ncbi:polysaccharide lyase family 7 protein [Croceibacter atlanticus]|jgi:hypothetical protein|uniref:Putative alginate lyase n=1 Tax=Croceibacter atlanticus (strain ATCC BAA-628 / JCM 21780 / CIP 108009 / IAM 15332 / KCTC 12090 / HTCC2559) TaxID=216432 RepID=A3UA25_CROAH|nr:polysaccharide lyase family 7 protein [Croceibacter atlanticus]EAP86661.1 putative alginate lyase [Croceibacter atlanticus HTCC2559]
MKYTLVILTVLLVMVGCKNKPETTPSLSKQNDTLVTNPSDVISSIDKWSILLGNGTFSDSLNNFSQDDFFYVEEEENTNWVVYKTPNSGITSKTSHNTRTELGEKKRWTPEEGGKLRGTLKVKHVSTSGDPRVAASFSVVVGQIHSDDGHENEPLKIFYKKYPGHEKGAVFWNYEINTEGNNSKRWDFSETVWGYNMGNVSTTLNTTPEEPKDGIRLGEEFSYEVNVHKGIMYLTFKSEGHITKTFTKSLIASDFTKELPQQIKTLYASIGRDGLEREEAYTGEMQFFKQGAYNQTNGKNPEENLVWNTGSKTFNGDITKQYNNGSFTEVWFKEQTLGEGTLPNHLKD